jgi:lipid-binding SYLF domain-containing protein
MRSRCLVALLALTLTLLGGTTVAGERQDAKLLTATKVLDELLRMPDQNIPSALLERAYAMAVVPDVIKVGLGIGARRGKGVLVIRKDSGEWSNPVFINLTGGSFGFQVGVQSADVVLVFTSRQSIEGIVGGKITLGADAAVAAGPVGRQTQAATDIGLNAQVYSYSRASGLFAGVALDGSALTIDKKSNEQFYGRPGVLASEIIRSDAPSAPESGANFLVAVQRSVTAAANRGAAASANATTAPATPAPNAPASVTPAPKQATEGALTTYPMEDPTPGTEPPR